MTVITDFIIDKNNNKLHSIATHISNHTCIHSLAINYII